MADPPLWQLPESSADPQAPVPSWMRPPAIRRVVSLLGLGSVLSVAYGVALVVFARSATVAGPPSSLAYGDGQILGGIIVGLVMAGLWLWMAAKVGTGRGWARILCAVFFGVWCLELISNLAVVAGGKATAASVIVFIVTLAEWIVGLTAIIILWRRESSDYFAATSRAKEMAAAYRARSAAGAFGYGQPGYGQAAPQGQPPKGYQSPQ